MPLYAYRGYDASGRKVAGTVDGAGRKAVLARLRGEGIYASAVDEVGAERPPGGRLPWRRRVAVEDLAMSTRQLAVLLAAGLTLDEALATVGTQSEQPHLARTLAAVRDGVVQGEALHAALARHPACFSELYVNLVQVGEDSGTLEQALQRLADFLEEQARLRGRILAAVTYPALMAVVGCSILIFLVAFVVPRITRMIADLGQALPLPTRILVATGELATAYGWLLPLVLLAGGVLLRRHLQTPAGALARDRLLLRLPLLGRLNTQLAAARMSRALATLLQSGMPLLAALALTRQLVGNRVLQQALDGTALAVREGSGLAEPLRRAAVLPPMVTQMIAVGERSGDLEGMLLRVAATYERQVEMTIERLLALLEPLMILVMGGLVGFIVLAILLPIFEASSAMG